jgi:hypothetical protein
MRDYDFVVSTSALRLIGRGRELDLLTSILLTDVLQRLSDYAAALTEGCGRDSPSPQCKRELTRAQGRCWIEFEVPEGAVFEYRDENHGPGFREVALVEQCHLSSNIYHNVYGEGVNSELASPGGASRQFPPCKPPLTSLLGRACYLG